MCDSNSNNPKTTSEDISDQLNELGKNLREALRSAWESEERRKLQKDIEEGLANLGESLSQAAKDFSGSTTAQDLKEDVKDMRDRWRSGEVSSKVHSEIVEALRKVNNELQKTVSKNPPPPPEKPGA
jgi:signal recognition particle GTPase